MNLSINKPTPGMLPMTYGAHASKSSTNESNQCFVPEMLIEYINELTGQGREALVPSSYFVDGVVLLVDISGFTKLSSSYCDMGKGGIDQLQLATNGYMGALVEVIYTSGGDIIKFAGDAIICFFSSQLVTHVASVQGRKIRRSFIGNVTADALFAQFKSIESEFVQPEGYVRTSPSPSPTARAKPKQSLAPVVEPDSPPNMGAFTRGPSQWMSGSQGHLSLSSRQGSRSGSRHGSGRNSISIKEIEREVEVDVLLRAMYCAEQLRDIQTDRLTVHVGVSAGEICFGLLGGYEDRWECLISGSCIEQLSQCLDDASSKQVVLTQLCKSSISREAAAKLGYIYTLEPLPSGNYLCDHVSFEPRGGGGKAPVATGNANRQNNPHTDNMVAAFVPIPVLYGRLADVGLQYLAEIREVTTMFIKFDGYDAQQHRDLLELQEPFLQAQKVLHESGAFLRQFLVDDKGCVLIACWGVPSLSYMDNAKRAVSSAALIRKTLALLGMPCSFGVTTGDVYCGTVGSPLRMEFAAIGSCVNIAARLMGKAKGGVLIDEATHCRLPEEVLSKLEAVEPFMVKGRDLPLQAYRYSDVDTKVILEGNDTLLEATIRPHCQATFNAVLTALQTAMVSDNVLLTMQSALGFGGGGGGGGSFSVSSAGGAGSAGVRGMGGVGGVGVVGVVGGVSANGSPKGVGAIIESQITSQMTQEEGLFSAHSPHSISWVNVSNSSNFGRSPIPSPKNRGGHPPSPTAQLGLRVVLVEGPRGSGRSTLIKWVKQRAVHMQLPTFDVRLSCSDSLCGYSMWSKIFFALMPREAGVPGAAQRRCLRGLLKDVYGDDLESAAAAIPALQLAFGLDHIDSADTPNSISSVIERRITNIATGITGHSPPRAKATPAHCVQVLFNIFQQLLTVRGVLLLVENVHFADSESLKVLAELCMVKCNSVVVLTALAKGGKEDKGQTKVGGEKESKWVRVKEVSHQMHKTHFGRTVASLENTYTSTWCQRFRQPLLRQRNTTLLTLDDYSPEEINALLSSALGLESVPTELLMLVNDFSGGGCFWVREILHFIHEYGIQDFMLSINPEEEEVEEEWGVRRNSQTSTVSSRTPSLGLGLGSALGLGVGISQHPQHPSRSPLPSPKHGQRQGQGGQGGGIGAQLSDVSQGFRRLSSNGVTLSAAILVSASASGLDVTAGGAAKSKLDQLVVCRFEKLSLVVRHVLRLASVIGFTFSRHVLYGVLPRNIKAELYKAFATLLDQKWLYQDVFDDSLFQFAHPYAHGVIYELTPSSERQSLHRSIADYLEETCSDDPSQYALLCYHYNFCDFDKSLQYTVQAVAYYLENDFSHEMHECIELIFRAIPCCASTWDVRVLDTLTSDLLKATISYSSPTQNCVQPPPRKISWFSILCSTTPSAVAPSTPHTGHREGRGASPGRSSPVGDSPVSPGSSGSKGRGFGGQVGGPGLGLGSRVGSGDLSDRGDLSYNAQAKNIFAEQLTEMRTLLDEKDAELEELAEVLEGGPEPRDWQSEFLGMSSPEGSRNPGETFKAMLMFDSSTEKEM